MGALCIPNPKADKKGILTVIMGGSLPPKPPRIYHIDGSGCSQPSLRRLFWGHSGMAGNNRHIPVKLPSV